MQRVQRCCYDRAAQTIVAPTLVMNEHHKRGIWYPFFYFLDDHAALFEISVSRSRNLLHRCYGRVKYAPYAMPRTTFYASQKHFQQQ